MISVRVFWLLVFFFLSISFLKAQKPFKEKNFILPVSGNLPISGSFGELRPSHFHTGIDFSTLNKENLEILSIDEGYISRIKVSATGYGKVIYITHPGGLVSVYAHLNSFALPVDDYVKKNQYEKQSFEIELFPTKGLFNIKKGDLVGYSGNSGSSSGPHLHFEIRSEITEHPINPLYSGMFNKETEKPQIENIFIYPLSTDAHVNGSFTTKVISVKNQQTDLQRIDSINVSGDIAFGVEAYDKNAAKNRCGIYSFKILIDEVEYFSLQFDSLDFNHARYINTLMDYRSFIKNGKRIYQTYISTGNRLENYTTRSTKGLFNFSDTNCHLIRIQVGDFWGNTAEKKLILRWNKSQEKSTGNSGFVNHGNLCYFGLPYRFNYEDLIVEIPDNALFDSIFFKYRKTPKTSKTYSPLHTIHDNFTPLFTYILVKIKPESGLSSVNRDKLCIAEIKSDDFIYQNTYREGGFFCAKPKNFGTYALVSDTIAPEIKPMLPKKNHITSDTWLKFMIKDNLSGIDTYNLSINNNWVLAEFDAKNNLLLYKAEDQHFVSGENKLTLQVTDKLKNSAVYQTIINY